MYKSTPCKHSYQSNTLIASSLSHNHSHSQSHSCKPFSHFCLPNPECMLGQNLRLPPPQQKQKRNPIKESVLENAVQVSFLSTLKGWGLPKPNDWLHIVYACVLALSSLQNIDRFISGQVNRQGVPYCDSAETFGSVESLCSPCHHLSGVVFHLFLVILS